MTALEERGTLQPERNVDEEKFYKGMMKQVRTVEMPALSDAQIQAARERRRQSHFDDEQDARGSLANVRGRATTEHECVPPPVAAAATPAALSLNPLSSRGLVALFLLSTLFHVLTFFFAMKPPSPTKGTKNPDA